MKLFLMKGVAQTSNIFHINGKKIIAEMVNLLQRQNSRLEYVHQTKIRRNKMFTSSDNTNISIMSLSSVEIHLLAELTVDFTVLQIFFQVTHKIISKLCMKDKYFLSLE